MMGSFASQPPSGGELLRTLVVVPGDWGRLHEGSESQSPPMQPPAARLRGAQRWPTTPLRSRSCPSLHLCLSVSSLFCFFPHRVCRLQFSADLLHRKTTDDRSSTHPTHDMPIGERGWLASVRLRARVAADLDPNVDGRLDLLGQRHVQPRAATTWVPPRSS